MTDIKETASDAEKYSVVRSFLPRRPLQWVGVVIVLGAVAGIGGGIVAVTGLVNLSAVPPHPVGWAKLLKFGMTHSVEHNAEAPPSEERLDDPAVIMRGATQYAVVCENCHGAPGYGQSPVALSLRPEPPMLLDVSKEFDDKELYFIVQNGVRYAGMPAWPVLNRPDEIWATVAFLKANPGMSRETYNRLAHGAPEDLRRAETAGEVAPKVAPGGGDTTMISPFVPSGAERPYLPGDPQDPDPSPAATVLPRIGFSPVGMGEDVEAACASCHGADGAGRSGGALPNLTLQSPQYLYDALNAFATGQRQSGIMWDLAGSLTDAQMRSIALRYGTAAPVPSRQSAVDAQQHARGADIVGGGLQDGGRDVADKVVPVAGGVAPSQVERCSSCHLPGAYLGKVVPRLEGQYAAYTRMQLRAFRKGGRGSTSNFNPMVADSHNLGEDDIVAVAAYYAAQSPLPKTKGDAPAK
jgi:cytochrome c553